MTAICAIRAELRYHSLCIVDEVLLVHVCHTVTHRWRTLRALRAWRAYAGLLSLRMLLRNMLLRVVLSLLHLHSGPLLLSHPLCS